MRRGRSVETVKKCVGGVPGGAASAILLRMRSTFLSLLALAFVLWTPAARAADAAPSAELLAKLAETSARFEAMVKRSTFTLTGKMEKVSGDGVASEPKEGTFRVRPTPERTEVEVIRYTEDGEDKTREAKAQAAERARAPKKRRRPKDDLHLPFLASEQPKYVFRLGEVDALDPARIRVHFDAKAPSKGLWNGSAWVDGRTGEILSMGVAPAETSSFLDYLRLQIEFGEATPMGRAVSKVSFEAGGSFLFVKKRFRGSATLADYALTP